jgi:predicted deacylase
MLSFLKKPVVWRSLLAVTIAGGVFAFFMIRGNAPAPLPAPSPDAGISRAVQHGSIGSSVEGRDIASFTYGNGKTHIVFVGGIHGGYEWNSLLLAYAFTDYLDAHPEFIPSGMTVTVVPSANPDGVHKVTGTEERFAATDVSKSQAILASGRFNAHDVDLNRNFDCKWRATSTWQNKTVSAGTKPFSEPETAALRDFFLQEKPAAVVFWHSQANAVYASQCQNGILPQTLSIMHTYAEASGYPAVKEFTSYETTGAADDWLASVGIPAITVELKNHTSIEWEKNLAGISALLEYFSRS